MNKSIWSACYWSVQDKYFTKPLNYLKYTEKFSIYFLENVHTWGSFLENRCIISNSTCVCSVTTLTMSIILRECWCCWGLSWHIQTKRLIFIICISSFARLISNTYKCHSISLQNKEWEQLPLWLLNVKLPGTRY